MASNNKYINALKAAFPNTVPILAGFGFLGITFGIYMNVSGFGLVYPLLMSLAIFAGSMEFVAVNMLLGGFDPLQALAMALMINARHLFYGISMLDRYKGTGKKKLYLIFGLCDETFSINYTTTVPEGVDKGWFMFFVTALDQLYWVAGTVAGWLIGNILPFSTEGLDFVLVAMFVAIFLDQWMKEQSRVSGVIGLGLSLTCLIVFGADQFIIPSMVAILIALTVLRGTIERRMAQ